MHRFDVVIIGAGAAGLFCAGLAGQLGLKVLVLDHAKKVAEKIRISGGGRCNFTNRDAGPANFLSRNPNFCRSALARYTPQDFVALVQRHRIPFHEKHKGQLFCDDSSEDIIRMLLRECEQGGVTRWQPCAVAGVRQAGDRFELDTAAGPVRAARLVVATGGLSIPQIGASDFGYRLARQFGHAVVETRPALVPLTFDAATWAPFAPLAGVSLEVGIACGQGRGRAAFVEDLLFTHRGLSGPATLQVSSYWTPGQPVEIDLSPRRALAEVLRAAKAAGSRRLLRNELAAALPARLAEAWLEAVPQLAARPVAEARDRDLETLAQRLHRWQLVPGGTEGYRKAEVTAGGVDTRELSSQSMESRRVPGLHFIGEVVDVTGWLGGYNFQWAWASAAACARALAASLAPRSGPA
ncbi:NAD(P)/FAD-dependent oxidoreductase [Caldimonas thermodepolymerans]|uniref:NAD(P)/FAD-dependent oxidoreductase n=1 Tax=Caldimonas thermodepolymerans TaxID=215580 RepID=UPI00223647D5|nr:NAD(P)/FAD-dependent oxidoreductase [Caldimonas thermodepolymerans]UZG45766.1 NAD(P)/FAD-dependent oxidoreductase [Caldimonas thermodepolymerans]